MLSCRIQKCNLGWVRIFCSNPTLVTAFQFCSESNITFSISTISTSGGIILVIYILAGVVPALKKKHEGKTIYYGHHAWRICL
jgi:hypothetical protein